MRIAIIGYSGSGKSTLAAFLGSRLKPHGARPDGGNSIGIRHTGIIVGVYTDGRPAYQCGLHHLLNLMGKTASIGIAKIHGVRSAAGGRMNAGHGILGVMLISVKEMLSIEDHLLTHPL